MKLNITIEQREFNESSRIKITWEDGLLITSAWFNSPVLMVLWAMDHAYKRGQQNISEHYNK